MRWTKEAVEELRKLNGAGLTKEEIATKVGASIDAVAHAMRRHKIRSQYGKREPINHGAYAGLQLAYKDIVQAIRGELGKTVPARAAGSSGGDGDVLCVHFTDWHIGKEIKNEAGSIIFNSEIAKQRLELLTSQVLSLLDNHVRKGVGIEEVCVFLTGDICDGAGIFASQETQSEMAPPFQVMMAVLAVQAFLMALLERNLRVRVFGVRGNHGEVREAGKSRDPNANWDLMVYLILTYWVRGLGSTNLSVQYSEFDYLNCNVAGWQYHLRHIAPVQSETSAGKARFLGWARTHKFDALVYGHFHHWGIWDRSKLVVMRGGSLPGADEFSEQLSEESAPTQLIWGVSRKRPITFSYAVDLGGRGKRG